MNSRKTLTMIMVISLILGSYHSFAQTAEELFPKGIQLEEVKGELEKAIEVYQTIVTRFPENRQVAAKAQFHIGLCYEKLGLKQAQQAYQKVLDNYPEQEQEIALAKERLNRILAMQDVPFKPDFRKVRIPTEPGNGVLSPDGKKLAFVSEQSLWVLPLSGKSNPDISGEPKQLTPAMGLWNGANRCLTWSLNSKWIAFRAMETDENNQTTENIYLISSNGGKPKKIETNLNWEGNGGYDWRISISPTGDTIAFVSHTTDKKSHIYTLSSNGGTEFQLTGPDTREPAFSPDGKWVAYVKVAYVKRGNGDITFLGHEIWIIPSRGGTPTLICDKADVVKSPIWSPDGSMIAFLARKYEEGWANNSNELWIVPLSKNGKPSDSPTIIDLQSTTISMLAGWSKDNKIGFWFENLEKNIIYSIPVSGGNALQLTPKDSWMPNWTPDNKSIYFLGLNIETYSAIEYIPANGGPVARIPIRSEYKVQPALPSGGISISPNGEKIVFAGFYVNIKDTLIRKQLSNMYIMTVPTTGGDLTQLTTNPGGDGYPVWSPDGDHIAFIRPEVKIADNKTSYFYNIYIIQANGGNPKKLSSVEDKVFRANIDWSPDGKWVAYFSQDKTINLLPVKGGESIAVVKNVDLHSHFGLSFSPDGRKIVYASKEKIWTVAIDGGDSQEIRTGLNEIHTMPQWSPDGEKIAFSTYSGGGNDLWVMENFLPKTETKK